jgi:hypothetical protein
MANLFATLRAGVESKIWYCHTGGPGNGIFSTLWAANQSNFGHLRSRRKQYNE